jgi:hypothetical protein
MLAGKKAKNSLQAIYDYRAKKVQPSNKDVQQSCIPSEKIKEADLSSAGGFERD